MVRTYHLTMEASVTDRGMPPEEFDRETHELWIMRDLLARYPNDPDTCNRCRKKLKAMHIPIVVVGLVRTESELMRKAISLALSSRQKRLPAEE